SHTHKGSRSNWCQQCNHLLPCLSTIAQEITPKVSTPAHNATTLLWRTAWHRPGLTKKASHPCLWCCLLSKLCKPTPLRSSIPKPPETQQPAQQSVRVFLWRRWRGPAWCEVA